MSDLVDFFISSKIFLKNDLLRPALSKWLEQQLLLLNHQLIARVAHRILKLLTQLVAR